MSLYFSSGRLEEKRCKARLLCVVPVITVVIVIHAHVNFNRGWLDRVFLNCGWLDRGLLSPTYHHDHHCDCSGVIHTFQLHIIYLYKTTVHCYIPLHKIVDLYCHYLFTYCIFYSSFYYLCFCPVTDILLHCGSFCHENKFLVCVNMPGNKADSDYYYDMQCSSIYNV